MAQDTFTRSTSYGLGTDGTFTYVWVDRDTGYATAADSLFHVDGSKVVIPDTDGNDWDSYVITGVTPAKAGSASFDIYLPSLPTPPIDYIGPVYLHLAWTDIVPFGFYQEVVLGVDAASTGSFDPRIIVGPYAGGGADNDWRGNRIDYHDLVLPYEPDNWYTAKVSYQISGAGDHYEVLAGYKFWKTSDPEPSDYFFVYETNSDWTRFGDSFGDGYDGRPWLDFYYNGTEEAYLDNLTFDSTAPTGLYRTRTIDAIIRGRQELEVCDPITTTTAFGLGPEYPFIPGTTDPILAVSPGSTMASTLDDEGNAFVYTDGSKVVFGAVGVTTERNAYTILGRRARAGWTQFDFFVPTPNPSVNTNGTGARIVLDGDRDHSIGVFAMVVGLAAGGSTFQIMVGPSYVDGAFSAGVFIPANNTWHTAKVIYDDSGRVTALAKPQGAPDSSAYFSTEINIPQVTSYGTGDRIVFSRPPNGNSLAVDNICWVAERLTIDAVIVPPVGVYSFTIRAVIQAPRTGSFTIDARVIQANNALAINAVVKRTQVRTLTLDAVLAAKHFTIDAFIADDVGLLRHFRERDHSGTLSDAVVLLDQDVGPWQAGKTLHDVLVELWTWVEKRLE